MQNSCYDDSLSIKKIVRQSNELIESPYAQEFSVNEIKLFEITIAHCFVEDLDNYKTETDKKLSFNNMQLSKLLNIKPNSISMEIENIAKRLMNKKIHLKKILDNGTIEFILINIIPFAQYKNGTLNLRLNYSVLPYLLDIKEKFTEYNLYYLLRMRSAYAIKLYKLLYQYRKIKKRNFTIEELKNQFGISSKYSRYNDFKKDVLNISIKQINELTDLNVKCNEIKIGRTIKNFEFSFNIKNFDTQTNNLVNKINDNLNNDIYKQISNQTQSLITKYKHEKGDDYINSCINYAKRNSKSNLDKYLADTLTKGWANLEIEKIENKKKKIIDEAKKLELENAEKKLSKQKDTFAKSEIEHEWYKLSDYDKSIYIEYSIFIKNKYSTKLASFLDLEEKLPISIYAVTKNKFYERSLEGYIKTILNFSLNIKDFIKNK